MWWALRITLKEKLQQSEEILTTKRHTQQMKQMNKNLTKVQRNMQGREKKGGKEK